MQNKNIIWLEIIALAVLVLLVGCGGIQFNPEYAPPEAANQELVIDANQIHQGTIDDCYIVASLAAIASKRPNYIRDMLALTPGNLGAGVTVQTAQSPVNISLINTRYNDGAWSPDDADGELWFEYIEDALIAHEGFSVSGGNPDTALFAITGQHSYVSVVLDDIRGAKDNAMVGSTFQFVTPLIDLPEGGQLVSNHCYAIIKFDETWVYLYNPWGFNQKIKWESFYSYFGSVNIMGTVAH